MKWILVNIGCIECGVSTNIVGVFDDEQRAHDFAEECRDKFSWREGGQNEFQIFEMPELNKVHEEYLAELED